MAPSTLVRLSTTPVACPARLAPAPDVRPSHGPSASRGDAGVPWPLVRHAGPVQIAGPERCGRNTMAGKVIISCAVTGAIHTPSMSDHLPITPEEIARSSIEAAEAGAAIIHLHARDPNTGE